MAYVKHFSELDVYILAQELALDILITTKSFPKEEMYSLTSQIRRCSRSVGEQIAESWGKRRYLNHFISKLTDGDSEQYETQHWTNTALACQYISKEKSEEWLRKCRSIGSMLQKMLDKAHEFCSKATVQSRR